MTTNLYMYMPYIMLLSYIVHYTIIIIIIIIIIIHNFKYINSKE
jgi:hypothetical protein